MPHISRQKIDPKVQVRLFNQLSEICSFSSSGITKQFLSCLLTQTEQLMLSKRLAGILMLHEGYSQYTVGRVLQLSSSTVARMYAEYLNKEYDYVFMLFNKRKKEKEEFWKNIEVLLRLGMPSMGRDRWKHLQ